MIRTATFAVLLAACVAGTAAAQSITLSPAVVTLRGSLGQSVTQTLTLHNGTDVELTFALDARDVVVRDGSRAFAAAGESAASIAATAVFTPRVVRIAPRGSAAVTVTLTLPPATRQRAVVALFHSTKAVSSGGRPTFLSLGTLFTFTLSDRLSLAAGDLRATPPTTSANALLASGLFNDGEEPVEARGVAVILGAGGAIVGKADFGSHRLLPGERATFSADYAGELAAGTYRSVATFEAAGRSVVRTAVLVVP
ncbi:MAG TPA: hypothetical protein VGS57_20910 [Thermoanaerobaculia bacterium]|nr:hypothetical protein [Thermoanaerobaculia bacterium]